MRFVNSHRYLGSGDAPVAFLYDDSVGSYSLRVLPTSVTWTQALLSVKGSNGVTDVFPNASGTIDGTSLTTSGDTLDVWNSSGTSNIIVKSWYAQNNSNTIDSSKTLTSSSDSVSPTLWTLAQGFNYQDGRISLLFDGSDVLISNTANSALSSPTSLTITGVVTNTLAASAGEFFKTGIIVSSLRMSNNTTSAKKTVGFAPYQLDSINTETATSQRITIFYLDGTTRYLAMNGVAQDTSTSVSSWVNTEISIGSGFTGNIQELTISDEYYTNTLTDLTSEINTYYQTY